MKNIVDYDLAVESELPDLAAAVRRGIQRGWQPFGSPFVDPRLDDGIDDESGAIVFCQAMVKYED